MSASRQYLADSDWSLRELLALSSAVAMNEKMKWKEISRQIRYFAEKHRENEDWCAPKICAREYGKLLESFDNSRRKSEMTSLKLSMAEYIVKRLTVERIEELHEAVRDQVALYKNLKDAKDRVLSGQANADIDQAWKEIKEIVRQTPTDADSSKGLTAAAPVAATDSTDNDTVMVQFSMAGQSISLSLTDIHAIHETALQAPPPPPVARKRGRPPRAAAAQSMAAPAPAVKTVKMETTANVPEPLPKMEFVQAVKQEASITVNTAEPTADTFTDAMHVHVEHLEPRHRNRSNSSNSSLTASSQATAVCRMDPTDQSDSDISMDNFHSSVRYSTYIRLNDKNTPLTSPSACSLSMSQLGHLDEQFVKLFDLMDLHKNEPLNRKHVLQFMDLLHSHSIANTFWQPVNRMEAPTYYEVVKCPLNLTSLQKNVRTGKYHLLEEFLRDLLLVFSNAVMYNNSGQPVHTMAIQMGEFVLEKLQTVLFDNEDDAVSSPLGLRHSK